MHQKMPTKKSKKLTFRIRNWKLALLAVIFIGIFTTLGVWQLSRASQKQLLLKSFAQRISHHPFTAQNLSSLNDWRFYRVELTGYFDNEHTFLLDNTIYQGKIGYEVYTPFHAQNMRTILLVDRGFVPLGTTRSILPPIRDITETVTFIGMLNLPPLYMALGKMNETSQTTWPLRIEFIHLPEMSNLLNADIFPYVVNMDPHDTRAYPIEWRIVTMHPERHQGYAVQWFALALTLLVLFIALNRA
jgi:surfeit locus 1 family protein